ncbi:LamG-like jellyroll fold domain-containing protein [Bythopirellula polymerisocia]|uniref:LamG-like jellyroll fold domain-containing protein n=1 Tax=Bythopirellula polymerisocia TaxID=2528003 RepID=A0A5C6CPQ5_9BACT|nr:LamG-like jellyroll fold domain-containing protein [Bythopirellula polymerisocia]TWU26015.1 hypothetical protein Pla144_32320 [Bythopirellula polymerisocia]
MRRNGLLFSSICAVFCFVENVQASNLVNLDFSVKNTPYTVSDYTDLSGNGHHGDESGTWWNFDGDTIVNADLWDDVGGARGGVFAHRSTHEQFYETQVRVGNAENNRVILDSTPSIAAGAGITLALWVNPEIDHVEYGNIVGGDAKFAHLIALGGYGVAPIVTIELDASKRVHGYIEGTGGAQVEVTGVGSVPANTWTHVAITYDRVNDVATTYINGFPDNTIGIGGVDDGAISYSSSSLGGGFYNSGHHDSFLGMMDNVMVFDEALSQSQIAVLVPEPSTLLLFGLASLTVVFRRSKTRID